MEKQLRLTKLTGNYVKDFDTFGKMDPFLVFKIGKCQAKTETASSQGKNPSWNTEIILTYLDEATMNISSYDEDTMSNDYMGAGTVDLKKLKTSGLLEIKIQEKGELIGTINGEYIVKTLPPTPFLLLKNIKCDFYKQTKFILKAKPYFSVSCGSQNMVTQVSEEGNGKKLSWNQNLRVKIKEASPITFSLLDKDDNSSQIFKYESKVDQFKTSTGKKQFYVHDRTFQPLGILEFQYETLNIVNREESSKNQEKRKQQENQMARITIQKIRGNLQKDGIDVYFKILCGPNMVLTNSINSAPKNFEMNQKMPFYAQSKQNKITFALWDKNMISDDVVGVGYLSLPTTAGEKEIQLKNKGGNSVGSIFVTIAVEKVTSRSICFEDIKLELKQKGDYFGSSQPYVIGRIGGWSVRTQTAEGQKVTFKKNMNLKFFDEDKVTFQIWQEDITAHDKLFVESYDLSKIKNKNGEITIPLNNNGEKKGQISMKYTTKNVQQPKDAQSPTKKGSQSKRQSVKKQTIKKQQFQKVEDKQEKEKRLSQKDPVPNITKQQTKRQQGGKKQNHDENVHEKRSIDQSSIDHSRNTFKLPTIQNRNFGDKIFDKQSSSTLQKSIHVYSMPKASRFGQGTKYAGEPSYYVQTAFKTNSGRGVGFGFGNKRQFPEWLEKNMKENPAPGSYFETRGANLTDGYRSKGPTFGIGHKYYEKVMIPKQKALARQSLESKHHLMPGIRRIEDRRQIPKI